MAICSCGGGNESNRVIPRRTAYPRVEALDSIRIEHAVGTHTVSISRSATATDTTDKWLTAQYPTLGAVLYMSIVPEANIEEAIANRQQRMSLNIGAAKAMTHSFHTDDGYIAEIVTAEGEATTPVQFVATDGRCIINGAFVLKGSISPVDSLRPIVKELEREAFAILGTQK